jgi:purine-binding chemotaxis protein CheW
MGDRPPPAELATVRRILEERARSLAVPFRSEEPDAAEILVMKVGAERYGVDTERVREVRHLAKLAPVPGIPQFWAGVVSIRGTLYPVLDLRRYLSLPSDGGVGAPTKAKKVVLVSGSAFTVGLMVDEAAGVHRVPAPSIGPPLAGVSETVREAVRGVTPDVLSILDIDALLGDPRLVVKETRT